MKVIKTFLKTAFIEIDSSSRLGKFIQRLRLVGLPLIPLLIFIVVCIQQLISYRKTMIVYQGMYNRAEYRSTCSLYIASLDDERNAFVYGYLVLSNTTTRIAHQSCVENTTEIQRAIRQSEAALYKFITLRFLPSMTELQNKVDEFQTDLNLSASYFDALYYRSQLLASGPDGCDEKLDRLISLYTALIKFVIRISPDFYEADLSKPTFVHVFALQHTLETYFHTSSLCYLAHDYIIHGKFTNVSTKINFLSNSTLALDALNKALALDESIANLRQQLLEEHNCSVEKFKHTVKLISDGFYVNMSFYQWHHMCREIVECNKLFVEELTLKERREGFEVEWRNCMAGIIFYTLGIVINIPALGFIIVNSETTLKSLKQFSQLFHSQADKLTEEKSRSEMLLNEMLPKTVSDQLKLGATVDAEIYESSTVYFNDIVDFNEIALALTPIETVDILNALYNLLDSKIECYDVYKMETIGSVYMVVSGVPERNGQQHPIEVANLSLDILEATSQQKFPNIKRKVELRIGIHTGPCVAGVVGNKMTRYCLFGDTVNTASRMQSTGAASKIHLSESTFLYLDETKNYVMEKRGVVEVKGKGSMTTYWLEGRKQE